MYSYTRCTIKGNTTVQDTDQSVSGIVAESDDEGDITVRRGKSSSRAPDIPQSLGLSINY